MNKKTSCIKALEAAYALLRQGETNKAYTLITSLPEPIYEEALFLYDRKPHNYNYYLVRYVLFSFEVMSKYNLTDPAKFDNLKPGKKLKPNREIELACYLRHLQELTLDLETVLSKPVSPAVKKPTRSRKIVASMQMGTIDFQARI